MSKILGKYISEFEDLFYFEKNNKFDIYSAYNCKDKRLVSLKVINKQQYKDYNLKREETILKQCKSENILNYFRFLETESNIILEQESYETNLHEYITNNGPSNYNIDFFKNIAIELAKALKLLYKKEIIHRNIKSSTTFLREKNGKYEVKLGEFSKAIFKKDNTSEYLNSFYYAAPEIINGDKYDEKCDIWSYGIVLYDLYFGELPYGFKPSKIKVIKAVNNKENFQYKKTNIKILDDLFDGIFKINPKERINHKDLFNIIFDPNFMNENLNIKKNNLSNSSINLMDEITEIKKKYSNKIQKHDSSKSIEYKKSISNSSINNEKYNNILYYDENKKFFKGLLNDCDLFEEKTMGGFILCRNMDSLSIVIREILNEKKKDNKIVFTLITSGSCFKKVIDYIKQNKEIDKCFVNLCIYCMDIKKYEYFKQEYPNHLTILSHKDDVIKFIKDTTSSKIRPFEINRLITFKTYNSKYKTNYIKIMKYFDDSDLEINNTFLTEIENFIINKDNENELIMKKDRLIDGFKFLDFKNKIDQSLKIFVDVIYKDLNNFLIEDFMNCQECVSYFTGKIISAFISYLSKNYNYYKWKNEAIYMGTNLYLSELLQYRRPKEKITFPTFIAFTEDKKSAIKYSNRENSIDNFKRNLKYSVIFILISRYKNNLSGINIEKFYKNNKMILFLPFTFFVMKEAKFNHLEYTADIYLEIY